MHVVKINIVDTEKLQTFGTCLLGVFRGAVEFREAFLAFYEAELGGQEDLVSLAGALEPLPKKHFVVAVETRG